MPDLVINFNEDGGISVYFIPISWIPGLDAVSLEPETVARFTESNVQHIHLDYHSAGMVLLANGQPILDFRYTDHDQLWSILKGLSLFMGEQGDTMLSAAQKILPVMKKAGVEIVAKFPVLEGRSSIPVASDESYTLLSGSTIGQFEDGARAAGIERFTLVVASDGRLTSDNFVINLFQALIPPDMELKLSLETVQNVSAAEISKIRLKNRRYGLVLELNGQDNPSLICYLDNLLAFAVAEKRWRNLAPNVSDEKVDLVRRVVQDVLLVTNIDITFSL